MLHVRVTCPRALTDDAVGLASGDAAVANLVVLRDVGHDRPRDLLMFDLARERADPVIDGLRRLGVEDDGSIAFEESSTLLSRDADRAEKAAPGRPVDGVIWRAITAEARDSARLSWSFLAFLTLATLIAGVGRYLDQPILIIGAMVVGPEFAPVFAICLGVVGRRLDCLLPALVTLAAGFATAIAVALVAFTVAHLAGAVETLNATTGELTEFIIRPDGWSVVVALLAGVAGVLSLTSAKSDALVGVFISVTTVPAAGTIALTLAVGDVGEASSALVQLLVNLAGMVVAGTLTLLVQQLVWSRVRRTSRAG